MTDRPKIVLDQEPLDEEERELMEAFDTAMDEGTLISDLSPEKQEEFKQAARNTLEKRTRISTRLPMGDLYKLKAKAERLGMPYQTLLASVIHRYVEGDLVDREGF